ncbi:MAG: hypothetical protein LBU04_00745 [Christensenellaceae bacterium]|jgi:hypothetical protein|nr:hypothetical protein [Christensenellaceae bacterium]
MDSGSYICRENENGTYTGIYCHWDCELFSCGELLLKHYSDREKLNVLLALGNLSTLGSRIEPDLNFEHGFEYDLRQPDVCVFYGRERGDADASAKTFSLKDIPNTIRFCYIYTLKNSWVYFRPNQKREYLILRELKLTSVGVRG